MKRIPTNESKSSARKAQSFHRIPRGSQATCWPQLQVTVAASTDSTLGLQYVHVVQSTTGTVLQGVVLAVLVVAVQVVYSATTRTRPPTPHPPETAANVKGGWLLLPNFQLLIIIIMIIINCIICTPN